MQAADQVATKLTAMSEGHKYDEPQLSAVVDPHTVTLDIYLARLRLPSISEQAQGIHFHTGYDRKYNSLT